MPHAAAVLRDLSDLEGQRVDGVMLLRSHQVPGRLAISAPHELFGVREPGHVDRARRLGYYAGAFRIAYNA